MFDSEIELDSLQKIRKALETIIERASVVDDPNDFPLLPWRNAAVGCHLYEPNCFGRSCEGSGQRNKGRITAPISGSVLERSDAYA